MVSLKKRSEGFTIIELLIVIVVIAILATLVIVTFTGIQQRARDSQRQTDINALDSHIEAYFATNGNYPTSTNLETPSWVSSNLKGLDQAALADPNTPASKISASQTGISDTVSTTQYGYDVYGLAVDGTGHIACDDTTTPCVGFTLTADLESGGTFSKSSNT